MILRKTLFSKLVLFKLFSYLPFLGSESVVLSTFTAGNCRRPTDDINLELVSSSEIIARHSMFCEHLLIASPDLVSRVYDCGPRASVTSSSFSDSSC